MPTAIETSGLTSSAALVNAGNVAAAYAACRSLTPDAPSETGDALAKFEPPPRRLEAKQLAGLTLVDDAWNANPISMREFLATMHTFRRDGRRAGLVLGEMADLGEASYHITVSSWSLSAKGGIRSS